MNYIGSKLSLLPFLEKEILEFTDLDTDQTFLDVCAGTGVVSQHFKKLGFRVIANDIQYYSYCLNRAYVGINSQPTFAGIVETLPRPSDLLVYDSVDVVLSYLNRLEGVEGFVYSNYCPGGTNGTEYPRQYFADENGKRCDAIRLKVEEWYKSAKISDDEYYYLLTSLVEAIDKVANTASVYGAFLKHIKQSARKSLTLERLKIVPNHKLHHVFNCDGNLVVGKTKFDILYIDPPYNQRQYCTNYHVLETIARYDSPSLRGVTGLRDYDDQKSNFCYKGKALGALDELIRRAKTRFVFLSYNSEGLMSEGRIIATMEHYGRVELKTQDYRRFRADKDRKKRKYKANSVVEFLFCLEKFASI